VKRASRLFSKEERRAIEAAVTDAESQTSAEIVPVVATVSGRYDRAEDLFGVVLAVIAVAVCWLLFQRVRPEEGPWAAGHTVTFGLLPVLIVFILVFAVGAALASWLPFLRLPFITRREMLEEVERAASDCFHRLRVRRTAGGTGVLIYVSLHEHLVRVLADDAIAERVKQSEWEDIGDLIIDGIREGKAAAGLIQAIRRCGKLLSASFPILPGDVNELSNELHLLD
jgi:putative membrane protein